MSGSAQPSAPGAQDKSPCYVSLPSTFGSFHIVWQENEGGPRILRIFLPRPDAPSSLLARSAFPGARFCWHPRIRDLGRKMQRFFRGDDVSFPLDNLAWEHCSDFQRRVLEAEHAIPRGWVSTYGRIAQHLGAPRAARTVGGALARNPFPILIPCHRAVRSNGQLGGFQGGVAMKRRLLEMEGVELSDAGRAVMSRVYYS